MIRHINPRRFATHSESLYKVCVSGVTTRDLCAWVHSLPIMRSVKAVTLHVGINDYPAGQISQNNWYELIALLKKSLLTHHCLSAQSSQPRGDSLNNAIAPSNRNLFKKCARIHMSRTSTTNTRSLPHSTHRVYSCTKT